MRRTWAIQHRPADAIPGCGWWLSPTGAILANLPEPRGGGDAPEAKLFPVVMVEVDTLQLTFDHGRVVADAVERVRSKLQYTKPAAQFCRPEFTISQLRSSWHRRTGTPPIPVRPEPRSKGFTPPNLTCPRRAC